MENIGQSIPELGIAHELEQGSSVLTEKLCIDSLARVHTPNNKPLSDEELKEFENFLQLESLKIHLEHILGEDKVHIRLIVNSLIDICFPGRIGSKKLPAETFILLREKIDQLIKENVLRQKHKDGFFALKNPTPTVALDVPVDTSTKETPSPEVATITVLQDGTTKSVDFADLLADIRRGAEKGQQLKNRPRKNR